MSERLGTRNNLLLVFAKYPRPGEVKTRLVPDLSPAQAAALSKALCEDTLRATSKSSRYRTIVCFAPQSALRAVRSWLGPDVALQAQSGGDLGARQSSAMTQALAAGYRKVVLIGSDCPTITAQDIEQALRELEDGDLVLGPSEDGGYYLVAASSPVPSIFQGITWSTERVLRETEKKAEAAGLTLKLLDVKYDLDSYADLQRYYLSVCNGSERRVAAASLRVLDSVFSPG